MKMNQNSSSAFYTDPILTTWASNAQGWAASQYKWPFTEGRISTTVASLSTNEDGYTVLTYPEGIKPNSIRLLTVGGKRFSKKNFYSFQSFIEDNPASNEKIYTDFGRVVLINPRADLSGTVTAWAQVNIANLATDTGTTVNNVNGPYQDPTALTIFSDFANEANEAIIEKMMEYAFMREKKPELAKPHEDKAKVILAGVIKRIEDEAFAYQETTNDGMFERFDVVNGGFTEDLRNTNQF